MKRSPLLESRRNDVNGSFAATENNLGGGGKRCDLERSGSNLQGGGFQGRYLEESENWHSGTRCVPLMKKTCLRKDHYRGKSIKGGGISASQKDFLLR